MKNFVQKGDVLSLIAPAGGVTSGLGVQIGAALFAVASITAAAGAAFDGEVAGVFDLVAETAVAWTAGDVVYWDNTAKKVTKTVGTNLKIGIVTEDKLAAAAVGRVLLVPGF